MRQALIDRLLADAGLAALVGSRVDWLKRPQAGALPAITLQVTSSPYTYTMKGRTKLVDRQVQMDSWAADYPTVEAVRLALVAALDGPYEDPIRGLFIENERESFEGRDDPDSSGSTDFFRVSLDIRVWSDDAA
jgi:hypothetical protein